MSANSTGFVSRIDNGCGGDDDDEDAGDDEESCNRIMVVVSYGDSYKGTWLSLKSLTKEAQMQQLLEKNYHLTIYGYESHYYSTFRSL